MSGSSGMFRQPSSGRAVRGLALRQERLERPDRGGAELCPIDLLFELVKCLVTDCTLVAEPMQLRPLSRDRPQAEAVVLRRALRLVAVSSHLACGEVAFADGSRRGRVLFSERVERRLHEAETAARDLFCHATVRLEAEAIEQWPKREA